MTKELTVSQERSNSMQSYCFANAAAFESAQRMAKPLAESTLVPREYQGNMANCVVALEVAQRIGASPLMVMQNLYIVHGKPSWSSQFIIAALNSCGRFTPLQFVLDGEGDDWGCHVTSQDKDGNILKGPRVSIKMAKEEGWYQKNGSKWKTMPEMMLRYRAASFFGKLYAPEILMGMYTQEEAEDMGMRDITPRKAPDLKDAFMDTQTGEVVEVPEEEPEDEGQLGDLLKEAPAEQPKKEEAKEESPSDKKLKEISAQIKKAINSQMLKDIIDDNATHTLMMSDEQQAKLNKIIEQRKKNLGCA